MALQPTTVYEEALPILKVGHIIKAGAGRKGGTGYYVVKEVRPGRFQVTNAAVKSTVYALNASNNADYNAISGNLDTDRIVHLQYVAIMTSSSIDVTPYWGKDPLVCKDVAAVINDVTVPQTSPLKIDRWSYDQSMYFGIITASATSVAIMFTQINYTVEATSEYSEARPPKKYLEISSTGNARFIES